MARIFIVPSELTVIKSKNDAEKVLDHVEGEQVLSINLDDDQVLLIKREDHKHWEFWTITKGKDNTLVPSFRFDKMDAVDDLYRHRKYYNHIWKD